MITPNIIRLELERLNSILANRIEQTKEELSSRDKLIMDLIDIGFKKISDKKYSFDIKNRGKSYITFMVIFRGKGVDIFEDHLVIRNKHEVPVSEFGESFSLYSVRYGRATEEIYKKVISLSEELSNVDGDKQ